MTHDALDAWLDQLEAYTSDAPTRREISERFLQTPHALLSSCLETIIRQGTISSTFRSGRRASALTCRSA